jgi:hypothetical protein
VPGLLRMHHAVWGIEKSVEIWQNFFVALFKPKRTESVMWRSLGDKKDGMEGTWMVMYV